MKRMKRMLSVLLAVCMLITLSITNVYANEANEGSSARETVSLNGAWSFTDPDVGSAVDVQVPHSWDNFKSAANLMANVKTCTYEKAVDVSSFAGKKLFLQFDGVNKTAVVSVDGTEVGRHTGGFSTFAMDITDACAGKDQVTIRVDVTNIDFNTMPVNSDFTHFGGIYRDVQLIAVDSSAYIANEDYGSDGVYLYTDVNLSNGSAVLTPHVMVSYNYEPVGADDSMDVTVKTILSDADGNMVKTTEKSIKAAGSKTAEEVVLPEMTVKNAHLWNGTADPYLYSVTTELYKNGEMVDVSSDHVGFRTFEVKGGDFYLNGKLYELHGVGMHQEFGAETNVTTNAQKEADIDTVLEMGANALRTSHYPHDQYIYDLCDEKGLLVWNEIPFYLVMLNTDSFKQNVKDNAFEMVKQGYNHPSIMVWGIQNEVNYYPSYMPFYPTQGNVEQIGSFMKELAGEVHALDPSRLIGQAEIDGGDRVKETASWTTADSDINVVGFNIYTGWYSSVNGATDSNKIPYFVNSLNIKLNDYEPVFDKASDNTTSYVLTEYGAGANINHHDELGEDFKWGGTNSSKGYITTGAFHPEEFQSYVHEGMKMAIYGDKTKGIKKSDKLWAAFAWAMFDFSCYRNEGDTTRLNTKGLVTADRKTKKDAFYFYKANWNKDDYFTHICSSRMNVRSEKAVDVKVYSNCESVDLIVNGRNLGKGTKTQDGVFVWDNVRLNGMRQGNTVKAIGSQDGKTYKDSCNNWVYGAQPEIDVTYALDKVYDGKPVKDPIYKISVDGKNITDDANVTLKWFQTPKAALDQNVDYEAAVSSGEWTELDCAPTEKGDYACVIIVKEGSTGDKEWGPAVLPICFEITDEDADTGEHYAYILGYDDGTIRPGEDITRAEAATVFFRLLSDEERGEYFTKENSYSDVSEDKWYNNSVSTLSRMGIINGYSDNTFRPKEKITRAEFAAMGCRFAKKTEYTGENRFQDVSGHWAETYINIMADMGIINGYPDGTFCPNKQITRAEVMTIGNRLLKRTPDAYYMISDMTIWSDNADPSKWYYADVQEAANSHKYTRKDSSDKERWMKILENKDWSQL